MAKKRKSRKKKDFWYYLGKVLTFIFYDIIWRFIRWFFKGIWYLLRSTIEFVQIKFKENKEKREVAKKEEERIKQEFIESEKEKQKEQEEIRHKKAAKREANYRAFTGLKSLKGKFTDFEDYLLTNKSTIGIILGARGTGKTAIGMKLLENIASRTDREIYALGFKKETLPDWIYVVDDVDDVETHSIILVDEGGITFGSRDSMSDVNKFLSQLLLVARHKDLSVIFISQNSSNIDVNAIRQADYIILKPSSLLQLDFERKRIKKIYEEVMDDFEFYKRRKGLTYIYSDKFKGFITNPLPSFWTDRVSKSFENFGREEKDEE